MISECYKNKLKNKFGPDTNPYLDQIITPEAPKLGPDNNFTANINKYINKHIYIYILELKTGPNFAFFSVKNWSIFCYFLFFGF